MLKGPGKSKLLDFKSDIKKLRTHLIVCGAFLLVIAVVVLLAGEKRIYDGFRGFVLEHDSIGSFLQFFSDYGNYAFYALFLVICILGLIGKRRELFYYSLIYVLVQLIAAVFLTRTLKIIIGRPRPGAGPAPGSWMSTERHSFPSGHTVDMACSSSVLSYFVCSITLKVVLYILLVLMGLSRIGVGSHYPFDVVAGAFIGLFTGFIVSHLFASRLLPRILLRSAKDEKETPPQ